MLHLSTKSTRKSVKQCKYFKDPEKAVHMNQNYGNNKLFGVVYTQYGD